MPLLAIVAGNTGVFAGYPPENLYVVHLSFRAPQNPGNSETEENF